MGNHGMNLWKMQILMSNCGGTGQERKKKREGLSKYLELGVVMVNGKTVRGSSNQSKGELGKWIFHK